MSPEDALKLKNRKEGFEDFFNELMPVLVDFIEKIGITPAHQVLKHVEQYVPLVEKALQDMVVTDNVERVWLLTRMSYFVGEYFSQKYEGCWYVSEIYESRYFSRYVVGQFSKKKNLLAMIDPFEIAKDYVDSPIPRKLTELLFEVDKELDVIE